MYIYIYYILYIYILHKSINIYSTVVYIYIYTVIKLLRQIHFPAGQDPYLQDVFWDVHQVIYQLLPPSQAFYLHVAARCPYMAIC